jgi:hypothetical protein
VHAIVHVEPLAHVTLVQPLLVEHVSWQARPLGHVKLPPGLVAMHTGGVCVVSHDAHPDGHAPLPSSTQ